jgi:hypothetical protein
LASFNGRYYWEVFDPDPSLSEKPCISDLGDDLLGHLQSMPWQAPVGALDRGD